MSALSNYLENALLDHVTGEAALSQPAALYLALFTDDPTDAGTGTEAAWTSYARKAITFGAASGGTASSSNAQQFDAVDTGDGPVTITHVGIYDAATAGNLLFHAAISNQALSDGGELQFNSGSVTVSLD